MRNPLTAWRKAVAAPLEPVFAGLPVRMITVGAGGEQLAVHVAGSFAEGRIPMICLPGYNRNMVDFAAFVPLLQRALGTDWPVVLVDLRGRGRSPNRRQGDHYNTIADAHDVSMLARALGIEAAIVLGQGHGGQVALALALERPELQAATILLDAGPVNPAASLVRLRGNAEAISSLRDVSGLTLMLRRMTGSNYPGVEPEELDALAARTHRIDASGRAIPRFDMRLIEQLRDFGHDDVLAPQWQLFDLLKRRPLMLVRTERTDQVLPEMFAEMQQRRPDAVVMEIGHEGSPSLLNRAEEAGAMAEFVRQVNEATKSATKRG
jgi:pimeloyl-ACP methyl ester carboxylesterase